ncbi:MAG: hypothetical protein V1915_01700 [Candidatus Bathyarchaeota archaeon]
MASGFNEKIDAFDLIINALKDHEKRLDEISHRLESLFEEQPSEKGREVKKEEQVSAPPPVKGGPQVICSEWNEFKETCKEAKMITFEVKNNTFQVYAMVKEEIIRYLEDFPNMLKIVEEPSQFIIDKSQLNSLDALQFLIQRKLRCGFNLSIKSSKIVSMDKHFLLELVYDFDGMEMKEFLSKEVGVSKKEIVEGKITY